ncbi:MAG TPA: GNAT family N-acetyltransferase [Gemmatimonadaceae bacterium]|jgi:GNAT superfamily N-acetyltransferase
MNTDTRPAAKGPNLEVRPAGEADMPAIAVLLTELGYPTEVDDVPARLAAYDSPDYAVLLAESDGEAVALVGLHVLSSLHVARPACYITGLIVSGRARRQGVGRRLLDEAEAWARVHGCNRITVTSASHREGAHAFYVANGFPETGRRFVRTL